MYAEDATAAIKLAHSPSLLLNNLSSSPLDTISYVRLNEVCLDNLKGDAQKLPRLKAKVHQCSFVDIHGKCVLAVTTNNGVQVWSASGDEVLFQFELSSLFGSPEEPEDLFMRGLAVISDMLCVGCSTGNILIFGSKDGPADLVHHHRLDASSSAIFSLSAFGDTLACGNDYGDINGFSSKDSFKSTFSFPGLGSPCTTMCQSEEWLFAGYSSGHIRVYRTDIMEMNFEITAHTRSITGMALSNTRSFLASCGKDQFVHIWSVPDYSTTSACFVSLLSSEMLENKLCTGLTFLTDDRLCIASYDDDEIVVLRKE